MVDIAESLRLAEQLSARLCHELSGPIGSLHQVLALLQADPANPDALALAQTASADLVARLRLLRAAWGPESDPLDGSALVTLAAGLRNAGRVSLDLSGLAAGTRFPPTTARVVLNILLLAAESLPTGGWIGFSGDASDLFIGIDGPGAAWPKGLALCAAEPHAVLEAATSSQTLQLPLTALLAKGCGLRLSLLMGATAGGPAPLRLSSAK